jgi:hypothetical protein
MSSKPSFNNHTFLNKSIFNTSTTFQIGALTNHIMSNHIKSKPTYLPIVNINKRYIHRSIKAYERNDDMNNTDAKKVVIIVDTSTKCKNTSMDILSTLFLLIICGAINPLLLMIVIPALIMCE